MYNRTKKEIHDRIVVLHAEERQQGIVKDALNKLSEQESGFYYLDNEWLN